MGAAARLAAAAASLSATCTEDPGLPEAVTSQHQAASREPSQIWPSMQTTKSPIANNGSTNSSEGSSNGVKGLSTEASIEDLWIGLRREQQLRESSALGNVLLEGDNLRSPLSVVSKASGSKAVLHGTCHSLQQPLSLRRWPQHGHVPEDDPKEGTSPMAKPSPIVLTSPPLSARSSRAPGPQSVGGGGSVRDLLSVDSLMHSVDDEGYDENEEETTASLRSSITSSRAMQGRLSQTELSLIEAKLEVEGLRTQLAKCEGRLQMQDEARAWLPQENCPADVEARQLRSAQRANERLRTHCKQMLDWQMLDWAQAAVKRET